MHLLKAHETFKLDLGEVGARWPELLFLLWVVLLLVAPALLVGDVDTGGRERYIAPVAHAGLEVFCGITAFLIAGLLAALSIQYRQPPLLVFGFAFGAMGAFDILHAATDPVEHHDLFVVLHTLSTVLGGSLLVGGMVLYLFTAPAAQRRTMLPSFLGLSGLVLVTGLAYLLLLPAWHAHQGESFPNLTLRAHELAGALFAVAAVGSFVYYRAQKRTLALLVAGMLLLFAESAYLFRYSYIWDPAWWIWHLAKMAFYLGILIVITGGVVVALRAVERSRRDLTVAHEELRDSHIAQEALNRELSIRNRMSRDAINCTRLPDTLDVVADGLSQFLDAQRYELTLFVPADEVAEVQRAVAGEKGRWHICVAGLPEAGGRPAAAMDASGALVLRANDTPFAALRPRAVDAAQLDRHAALLADLAGEIGPILHSALLYQRWVDAVRFRSALLRISALLGSTLELDQVLATVCRESAHLLNSDGVLVFLRQVDGRYLRASSCLLGRTDGGAADTVAAWTATKAGADLLHFLEQTRRPAALPFPMQEPGEPQFAADACHWSTAAVFPLLDDQALIGVTVVLRRASVSYSTATLEKGMLLAERVQHAIKNARSFEALRDANAQLRAAEESKLRAERLAALGQMAATVAHEVRNPLGAIENCMAVLRTGVRGQGSALDALEIVEEEVQRLERLTRNFLSFGKPGVHGRTLIHLDQVVHGVVGGVRRHVAHEGLPVEILEDLRCAHRAVHIDRDALHEVLWNLTLNAVQALRGEGRVCVRLRVRTDSAFIAVQDNGPGIPRDDRERVFEPFYSQRPQGAGLGLPVVRQFVQAWSGRVRIFGAPGGGTCFALRIPLAPPLSGQDAGPKVNEVSA